VDAAGIRDISSKIKGTNNKASNVYATFEALKQISALVAHKGITLKSIAQVEEAERMKLKELDTKSAKPEEIKPKAKKAVKKVTEK
jgi:ribosomal protein S5